MQIIPFPAHYQSVYTNLDISLFSLISCTLILISFNDTKLLIYTCTTPPKFESHQKTTVHHESLSKFAATKLK